MHPLQIVICIMGISAWLLSVFGPFVIDYLIENRYMKAAYHESR